MPIRFGTDGWRAVISDEFTFDNVRIVAQAIAEDTLYRQHTIAGTNGDRPTVVIGFDTRFLSDRYAITVAEVLAANGIHALLAQADAPTPMVSFAIVHNGASGGGVMITASHNPPRYNGIKLKSAQGGSASSQAVADVEARVQRIVAEGASPQSMAYSDALEAGLIQRFDPLPAYDEHIRTIVDFNRIRNANLRVAVDPMYGAGRVYLRELLTEAGCRVHRIAQRNESRLQRNPHQNLSHVTSGR